MKLINDKTLCSTAVARLAASNIQLLQDLRRLLEQLPRGQYQSVQAPLESSIGAHIRHILECYLQFSKRCSNQTLSYDHRERCPQLETQPLFALARIEEICAYLGTLQIDEPLRLVHVTAQNGELESQTSIVRELAHLIDHTTHHLAMVNVAGKLAQLNMPEQLGYSVATLQYQREQHEIDDAVSSHA